MLLVTCTMKTKIIILSVLIICLFIIPSVSSILTINSDQQRMNGEGIIFAEYATTTWCPQCPEASQQLYELYLQDPSFQYVTLVVDKNSVAQERSRDFTNYAIPSVYFDGGYVQFIGTSESLLDIYSNLVQECREQSNKKNLEMIGSFDVMNEDTLKISINVTNNENKLYFGRLRTYITEEESRWNDNASNPYHFGLIDFALDETLWIKKGDTITLETEWSFNEENLGEIGNVSIDNIRIFASVFHWIPHFRSGFMQFPYLQLYFAHYIDKALIIK